MYFASPKVVFWLLLGTLVSSDVVSERAVSSSSAFARIKQMVVRVIAPSAGCPRPVWESVKAHFPGSFEQPFNMGSSEVQVKADPRDKFERLHKELAGVRRPRSTAAPTVPEPKTILWALRGGYGLGKIMPFIVRTDYSREEPKLIVGYSDTTVLLNYFAQTYGWKGLHACCLKEFCLGEKSPQTRQRVAQFLFGQKKTLTVPHLRPLNAAARQAKPIEGLSAGGNITLLVDSLGTPWAFQGDQKILFLEDVNVQGYALDRLLTHLQNAGVFRSAKAVVFGNLGPGNHEVLQSFAKDLPIPVYQTPHFGHGNDNYPFGINFRTVIEPSSQGTEFSCRMTAW